MLGTNPLLPPKKGDGNYLDVQEIFATFQGEGPLTGHPAIFLRLGGCNLACKFCDTEFDSYKEMGLEDIIAKIEKLSKKEKRRIYNLVVITGGEPLRQEIAPLCRQLIARNFTVQIETNGTLYRQLPKEVIIICSPKVNAPKVRDSDCIYHPIRKDLLKNISAFKFLISAQNKNYQKIPEIGQSKFNIPIYLQPMDELDEKKNRANYELTLKLAQENGYLLSLQTHKLWGIR